MARQITLSQEPIFTGKPYTGVPSIRRILSTDPGLSRAMLVLLFLRYVEDNARELGVDFEDTERLDAISQAYGSAFFPAQNLPRHVATIAARIGMDPDAFQSYASGSGEKHYREAIALFDLKPGTFARDENTRELMDHLTRRVIPQPVGRGLVGNTSFKLVGDIISGAGITSGRRKGLAICDLRCGSGSMLTHVLSELPGGKRSAKSLPEVWALDPDPDMVATTSMGLLFSEAIDDFTHIRQAECLDTDLLDDARFDLIVCAFDPRRQPQEDIEFETPAYDVESATVMLASDLLAEGGAAIFSSSNTLLSGRSGIEMRALLLDENLIDLAVELSEDAMHFGGNGAVICLASGRADGEPVGLMHLSSDRLGRRSLRDISARAGRTAQADPAARRARCVEEDEKIRRVLAKRKKLPFVFEAISRDEIHSTADLPLRYSTYRDTVDVLGELAEAEDVGELAIKREEVLARLRELEGKFHAK
jgi:hypothetical protein